MITVTNARKNYGSFAALDDVTIDIPSGELTALLGPSGSGKSTLLRSIAGLESLDDGVVVIAGKDVTRVAPQKRDIGFVFQHYAAFKHMTVRDNVAFGLKIRKRPKAEIAKRVDELLGIVGLDGFQHRYPAQLSGGQRQRMALARALAVDPQVLLLDEPFGALDAKVRADLRTWLRRLHEEVHVTTVLVTHDQEEALDVADRIAVMNKGRIEQIGSPEDVYDRPANEFVMSFLGDVAKLNGHMVRPHDIRVGRDPGMALAAHEGTAESAGVTRATVDRVVHLGFQVRVEMRNAATGDLFSAQVTRGDAEALRLSEGETVFARATRIPELPGGLVPVEISSADSAPVGQAAAEAESAEPTVTEPDPELAADSGAAEPSAEPAASPAVSATGVPSAGTPETAGAAETAEAAGATGAAETSGPAGAAESAGDDAAVQTAGTEQKDASAARETGARTTG